MANTSARHLPPDLYFYMLVGSADNLLGLPLNSWALMLIVSGKSSLVQSELLTLNLLVMENMCSMWYFFSFVTIFCRLHSLQLMLKFYHAMSVVGRALFQCHVCVDRYLAVLHPTVFLRYKQIKYRGACLAAGWLLIICVAYPDADFDSMIIAQPSQDLWESDTLERCPLHGGITVFTVGQMADSAYGVMWVRGCGLMHVFLPEGTALFYIVALLFLVPTLLTELFCSVSIVRVLRRPGPGQKEKEGNRQKKRAVNIICMVLVMLVFNVVPFILMPFLENLIKVELTTIAFTLSTVGSSVQALLFLSRAGKLPC